MCVLLILKGGGGVVSVVVGDLVIGAVGVAFPMLPARSCSTRFHKQSRTAPLALHVLPARRVIKCQASPSAAAGKAMAPVYVILVVGEEQIDCINASMHCLDHEAALSDASVELMQALVKHWDVHQWGKSEGKACKHGQALVI